MSRYRDTIVNVTAPRTKLDRTARAILDALPPGVRVDHDALDAAIIAAVGDLAYKQGAMRGLRNVGHSITAKKARHLSFYIRLGTPDDFDAYQKQTVNAAYSSALATCRLMADPALATHPVITTLQQQASMFAVAAGTATGLSLAEVAADIAPLIAPLPPPALTAVP